MYRLSITHPAYYQGRQHQLIHYFEGWYIKQVTADGSRTLAIIPGVSYTPVDRHAFIQVIVSPEQQAYYIRFPIEQFSYAIDAFSITIGVNTFSAQGIHLGIHTDELTLEGDLTFGAFTPIRSTWWSPTIMGPLAYLPRMECIHGIVSMKHQVDGVLDYQGQALVFTAGTGYIEKDWGRSFPESYTWMHTNHFQNPSVSLVASVAKIPYLGLRFKGFFVNLQIDGHEYRFATYTGARLSQSQPSENEQVIVIRQGALHLTLHAHIDTSRSARLAAPKDGAMTKGIKEGLIGSIHVRLCRGKTVLLDHIGTQAGMEFVDHLID